jgi:hypothetical protein
MTTLLCLFVANLIWHQWQLMRLQKQIDVQTWRIQQLVAAVISAYREAERVS